MEPYFDDGTSTLYCGDCEEALAQMASDGVKVDKVITSPPYNIRRDLPDVKYDRYRDGMSNGEYSDWMVRVFLAMDAVLNKDGCVLWNVSYGNENSEAMVLTMADIMRGTPFTMADILVWKKGSARPNNVSPNKATRICEFVFVMCRRSEYDTFTANKRKVSVSKSGQDIYENVFNLFSAPNGDSIALNHSTFSTGFVRELVARYVRVGGCRHGPVRGHRDDDARVLLAGAAGLLLRTERGAVRVRRQPPEGDWSWDGRAS